MVKPLNTRSSLPLLFAGLIVALMLLGPAAQSSEAAQCKGSSEPASRMSGEAAAKATLCLLNKERAAQGMGALHNDSRQAEAAKQHNRLMVRKTCFSHLCPGEKDLVGRIASTGYLPCNCTWQVAENLAWGTGKSSSPKKIVAAWMGSTPHRINILNPKFDEIGIAVDEGSPEGDYDDAATYTTDFGFKG